MLREKANRRSIVLLACGVALATTTSTALAGNKAAANKAATKPAPKPSAQLTSPAFVNPPSSTLQPAEQGDDEKEILVVQALEQPTSLKINEVPITDAVRLLSEKTGVPIKFDRFTLSCLPYGSKTIVSARIENQPLKQSLAALLRPLACTYELIDGELIIEPRPALLRICRRATWDEVALIEKLYSTRWSNKLADSLKFQFQDMTGDAEANRKKVYDLAGAVGSGNAADVLECASRQYGWVWHPEGGQTISFCTRTRQVEQQLQRVVSAQYNEVALKDVLLDLADRAGVLLKMEPGVLSSLPTSQSERFWLTVENVSIRQALELIAGKTGLGYFVEPDGIRITASAFSATGDPSAQTTSTGTQASRNPVVGQITIPGPNGTSYGFFIREQDLPPEINAMRQEQIRQFVQHMRSPTTHPAK